MCNQRNPERTRTYTILISKIYLLRTIDMHRHRRFRHGPRLFHLWRPFRGFFWLFLLVLLFTGGRWWPGILVLIGLAMLFGSLFRDSTPQWPQNPPPANIPMPPLAPATPTVTPAPVQSIHRIDLLPATCSQCGGPIRSDEVKWTGKQSAACPYCGSDLPMKKL